MNLSMSKIVENLENVEKNIEKACERAGRERKEVTLIAVSKTKPIEDIKVAYDAGIRDFGENKVQEILDKYDKLPADINWHMIGHLQTNKVKYIIDKVCMIHSVDSLKLAEEISKRAVAAGVVMPVLIEINIGDEESKFGITFDTAVDFLSETVDLPGIKVKGFMCIAPYTENAEENRIYFKKLKQLYVDITTKNIDNRIVGIDDISILSMGMTGDYEVAVEEGATHIRVGTGIFGARDYTV